MGLDTIFNFTPKGRKFDSDLDKAVHEYNEAVLVMEDKRVRLLFVARKMAATDTEARKAWEQIIGGKVNPVSPEIKPSNRHTSLLKEEIMPECKRVVKLTETERLTVSDMVAVTTSAKSFAEKKIAMNKLHTYIEHLMWEAYTMK